MKSFLKRLSDHGMLLVINEELNPRFEMSAVLKLLGKKRETPAVLFTRAKGYSVPVCGNLLNGERKLAIALEVQEDHLWSEYKKRLAHPISPVLVKEGPVQEVIIEDVDLLRTIPVLTYHEKDVSPYITQGVTFLKDPETDWMTMGIHRLQVRSENQLGFYISAASVASAEMIHKAAKRDQALPVAIAIGVEPAVLLACYSVSGKGSFDKMGMAGGLAGHPIELVKARSSDIKVPANAMYIIEGKIQPDTLVMDGPFGEVLGYYISGQGYGIDVELITHQKDPFYSVTQPFSKDDHIDTVMKIQIEEFLKRMIPNLKSIGYHFPSCLVVVSIKKKNPWDSRSVLYTCLNMLVFAKYVIVVDEDVNPSNLEEVGFALAGRCQPEKDTVVITDVLGFDLDPSLKKGGLTSKIGLDATRPVDQKDRFEKIQIPSESISKANEILRRYLKEFSIK